jgi:hypothetical protein
MFWQPSFKRSMSNNTILKGLERMGYKSRTTGYGFPRSGLYSVEHPEGALRIPSSTVGSWMRTATQQAPTGEIHHPRLSGSERRLKEPWLLTPRYRQSNSHGT